MTEKQLIQTLVREVRNATGFERTPGQILEAMRENNVKNIRRTAEKILSCRDMVASFAKTLALRDQDRIPSSVDLDMGC